MPEPPALPELSLLEVLRRQPELWFRGGAFDVAQMCSLLVDEAMNHGAIDLTVWRADPWVALSSSHDWLAGNESSFFALRPDPDVGPNSSFVEVLLLAWCDAVLTWRAGEMRRIAGSALPSVEWRQQLTAGGVGRAIAFRPVVPDGEPVGAGPRHLSLVPAFDTHRETLAAKVERFQKGAS